MLGAKYRDVGRSLLPVKGWVTNANPELLEGHVQSTYGMVMRRAQLLEPRRQYELLDRNVAVPWTISASNTRYILGIFGYGSTLYSIGGTGITHKFDATAYTWGNAFTDTVTPACGVVAIGSTDYLRTVEANGNCYGAFTTGVKKIASTAATAWGITGAPRATDPTLTGSASASGFLVNNAGVAYRMVWGYVDANNNLVLGWPSGNVVLYNTSGAAQNVTVKAFIPPTIKVNANAGIWNLYVYRTDVSATGAGLSSIPSPGDLCRLVYQYSFTTTDVSNGYVQFTDVFPEGVNKGPDLYTNSNQGGIEQANAQPPICLDMTLYRQVGFFANTTSKHRRTQQMLGIPTEMVVSTGAGGFTKSGGNVVVTFTGSPDLTGIDNTMKLAISAATSAGNVGTFAIVSVNVGAFTITATNAGAVTEAGTASSRGIAAKIVCAGQSYHAIYAAESVVNRYFQITNTGSSQQNVALTMFSFVRVFNQDSGQATASAFYVSGVEDAAGMVQFEEQAIGGSAFTFQALGLDFGLNKWLPAAYNAALSSTNDASVARLYHTKTGEPEHVPLINYFDIGAKNKKILRIIANRDSLFILKEDGVFRLNGDPNTGAVPTAFDDTLSLMSPSTACLLRNEVYLVSPKGVSAMSDAGVRNISGGLLDAFSKLADAKRLSSQVTSIPQIGHMLASDRDGMLYLYTATQTIASFWESSQTFGVYILEGQYSVNTGAWTGRSNSGGWSFAPIPPESTALNPLAWAGASIGDVLYRHPNYDIITSSIGIFREVDVNAADWHTLNELDLSSAPLGDRVYITVTSGAGTSSIQFTVRRAGAITPETGDALLHNGRVGTLSNLTFLGGTSWSATFTPAFESILSDFSAAADCRLLHPASLTVQWHPITAGRDDELKRFGEISILFDTDTTLRYATLAFTTEIPGGGSSIFASSTDPLRLVRMPVPTYAQVARRLIVSWNAQGAFGTSTGGSVLAIQGLAYVYQRFFGSQATQ